MRVGSPMPRLTYQPGRISEAIRLAICSRVSRGFIRTTPSVHEDDAVHENAGGMYAISFDTARIYDRHLSNGPRGSHRHHRVEVVGRVLVAYVAPGVGLRSGDEGEITSERSFEYIFQSVDLNDPSSLRELRAQTGASEDTPQ